MKNNRVQHPFKKDWTCVIVKVKCICECHSNPKMKHFVPCCNNGHNEILTDEKPNN